MLGSIYATQYFEVHYPLLIKMGKFTGLSFNGLEIPIINSLMLLFNWRLYFKRESIRAEAEVDPRTRMLSVVGKYLKKTMIVKI